MEVVKRNGEREPVSFDKVKYRIKNMLALPEDMDHIKSSDPGLYKTKASLKPLQHVDADLIAQKVISGIYNGVHTKELDEITAAVAQPKLLDHPQYGDLASRIAISSHHKNNVYDILGYAGVSAAEVESELFTWTMRVLYNNEDNQGVQAPMVAPYIIGLLSLPENRAWIESQIDYSRDYNHDFMGFKLLLETYLQKAKAPGMHERCIVERPQHLFMRVAIGIHCAPTHSAVRFIEEWNTIPMWRNEIKSGGRTWADLAAEYARPLTEDEKSHIELTYTGMSCGYFTHATPTLFNAGTVTPQLSSCYLTTPPEDSIEGITKWWSNSALLSKWAGGIGSHIHKFRAKGSYIRGTGGTSNGIKPWLKTVDQIAVGVDQGGNKRPGSHAIYLGVWHADIMEFLSLRKIRGNEEDRARNLFYAMWKNDEFMRCVAANADWYLMCPDECPGLDAVYDRVLCTEWLSDEMLAEHPQDYAFTELYRSYVRAGKYKRVVKAKDVWELACEVTIETGIPYQSNAEACNRKSNFTEPIKCSNLCHEILIPSTPTETAVCNLTSICLPAFVRGGVFDYDELRKWVRVCVYNLDRLIDINFYPIQESKVSNIKYRPMGIGQQGLHDVFIAMRVPFGSQAAKEIDFRISEVIYMEALRESARLASEKGAYPAYRGSPASAGQLQMDLWKEEHENGDYNPIQFPLDEGRWVVVREDIAKHGLRNSVLTALMPTGSTSTIMGNSPCIEPYSSIVYKRRNKAGEFTVVNKTLIYELIQLGLWNTKIKNQILSDRRGSIADVVGIPKEIKE
jgi:ribonucleoside-diphosphate reductase alpha subunit